MPGMPMLADQSLSCPKNRERKEPMEIIRSGERKTLGIWDIWGWSLLCLATIMYIKAHHPICPVAQNAKNDIFPTLLLRITH